MAEINNVIAEASQDLQTIEDFVNLPAGSDVRPRLLPSVNVGTLAGTRQAIFEAGGLPATPFPTKALMITEGATLADGDYAVVTNDTSRGDNGYYIKESGSWFYSELNKLYKGVGTVIYYQGKVNWSTNNPVRVGSGGYAQSAQKIADVSQMSSVKLQLNKITASQIGLFQVRIFFHNIANEVVSGDGTEPSNILDEYTRFLWNTEESIDFDIDVTKSVGLLVVIAPTSSSEMTEAMGESMSVSMIGTPFDDALKTRVASRGKHKSPTTDFFIGEGTNYSEAMCTDIRKYSAVRLSLRGLEQSATPILVHVLLYDKTTKTVSGAFTTASANAKEVKTFSWNPKQGGLEEQVNVVGYVSALVIIQFRSAMNLAGADFYHNLTLLRDKLDRVGESVYIKRKYTASQLYGTDLSPKALKVRHNDFDGAEGMRIYVKSNLPDDINLQVFELLDGDTAASIKKWNGVGFAQIEGAQGVTIKGGNSAVEYFDVTDIFNYASGKGFEVRITPLASISSADKFKTSGGEDREISIIYKGLK